ncbi:hypothetical protein M501DRAFT_926596 [Patellaria atrata CBS 101060]|uniref:Uncharacterized protein n=1 Tax=Patellaria atrata CBS 101060 TaxID=1346257 RepID=A0A9P4VV83_9PEZI|nr:hypothetical protein M501DRAFT_926596 [Patellaria atrata CBS 101060]
MFTNASYRSSFDSTLAEESPPPYELIESLTEQDKADLVISAQSVDSISSIESLPKIGDLNFTPGKRLIINAVGIGWLRLPVPSGELEIAISDPEGNLAYISKRSKRWSGNSVLLDSRYKQVLRTTYFFGPSRNPRLDVIGSDLVGARIGEEIKTTTKWTSRSHCFVMLTGEAFEWSYDNEVLNSSSENKKSLVILRTKPADGSEGKKVAQLVRTKVTRPRGSGKSSAGNGGELVLAKGAEEIIDPAIVVASCLLMLKKEVDRRRAIQIMIMMAPVAAA